MSEKWWQEDLFGELLHVLQSLGHNIHSPLGPDSLPTQDKLPHGWLSHLALTLWVSTTNSVLEMYLRVGHSEKEQACEADFVASVTSQHRR